MPERSEKSTDAKITHKMLVKLTPDGENKNTLGASS